MWPATAVAGGVLRLVKAVKSKMACSSECISRTDPAAIATCSLGGRGTASPDPPGAGKSVGARGAASRTICTGLVAESARLNSVLAPWSELSPLDGERRLLASHGNRAADARVVRRRAPWSKGRFIGDSDLFYLANVCVIGSEVAEKLFPFGDPVGKSIRIGENHFYRIIGLTEQKAPSAGTGSSLAAQDFNKDVYIPLTTDRARFGEVLSTEKSGSYTVERIELSQITVAVNSMDNVKRTAAGHRQHAPPVPSQERLQHHGPSRAPGEGRGHQAHLQHGPGLDRQHLAVGRRNRHHEHHARHGLGANPRDRYPPRLGAKRRDIIQQFLIETTVMSGSGGIIGVILGLSVPPLVARFSGIPVVISPWSPIVAFLIAVVTGIVFGVYPARRAAMLDPVEALRNE